MTFPLPFIQLRSRIHLLLSEGSKGINYLSAQCARALTYLVRRDGRHDLRRDPVGDGPAPVDDDGCQPEGDMKLRTEIMELEKTEVTARVSSTYPVRSSAATIRTIIP